MRDAYGNELHEGDWVLCHVNKMIRLKVVKIQEAGKLAVPNGDATQQIGFVASQWTAIDPIQKGQDKIMSLFKTLDPEDAKRVDDAIAKVAGPVPIPRKN